MLLLEKVIKLLDDFHYNAYREHVKNLSIRSYYPLALIDVVDRSFEIDQESELLYKKTYGDAPENEKDLKKFFQLAHYTFRQTSFLAKNYPNYLQHNISRVEQLINQGKLDPATTLAQITLEVAEKIEDFDTEIKILSIQAQMESLLESNKESVRLYERIDELLQQKLQLNKINLFAKQQLKTKGKQDKDFDVESKLEELRSFINSGSFSIKMLAKLNICYLLYLQRDPRFYEEKNYKELLSIEKEIEKHNYILFPFLHNIQPKIHFLKLNFATRQFKFEDVLKEAKIITENSQQELFWNSFINLPEINSIAIQSSYLVSNHFTSYRSDHDQLLSPEIQSTN